MRNIKIFFIILFSFFITKSSANEVYMNQDKAFEYFLEDFVKNVETKEEQVNKASWILETTGSKDAADLVASLSNELCLLFCDKTVYDKLINFKKENIQDPLLKRQLDILIKRFKANMLPKELLKEILIKEADLSQTYANFRAQIDNKKVSENEINDILKTEKSIDLRKKAWEASKEIGLVLAPKIINLVKLRNKAANHLGYDNYFDMTLDLNDINKELLFKTFENLKNQTDTTYSKILIEIDDKLSKKFNISKESLGPWAWKDPFCQTDPIESPLLNDLFKDKDILAIAKSFYEKMGFDLNELIKNSDLYESEGKNQHAFCISIDRKKDVRTLNNIKPNVRWMETLLHEFGHGLYDLAIDEKLPWLLRTHPHILATEAIALLMGRQVYTKNFLKEFCNVTDERLLGEVEKGYKRRLLIFSRFDFLITDFENQLYINSDQDLNKLWWDLYEKYYNRPRPENRDGKADWAAKYHIGLAPVYYYSYLLGEVFASLVQKELLNITEDDFIWKKQAAKFLKEKMFSLGSSYRWDKLIKYVTGKNFSSDTWIEECNKYY